MIRFNERSREFARAQNHISQVIKEFVQYRKNGFTSGEFVLSCLVSDGQLQREEALDIIRHKSEILDHEPPGLQDFLEAIHMGSCKGKKRQKSHLIAPPGIMAKGALWVSIPDQSATGGIP